MNITHGATSGGGSGATATTTAGAQPGQGQEESTSGGTLTNLASSPSITVNVATTSTSVVTSGSPSVYGSSVTFTATVSPQYTGTPGGTVTFKDGVGGTTISGCSAVAISGGVYTCTT